MVNEPSADNPDKIVEIQNQTLLTRIHDAYTLSDTHESGNEADKVMVKHFLNTLAEVALAIASRKAIR